MQDSRTSIYCNAEQIEVIKRLAGEKTVKDISIIINAGYLKTKREMMRLGLVQDIQEPGGVRIIGEEFFNYANEYNYKF